MIALDELFVCMSELHMEVTEDEDAVRRKTMQKVVVTSEAVISSFMHHNTVKN